MGDVSSSLRVAGTLVPSFLLVKPKGRKHRQWEQGQVTCEEQRAELYRDGVRKAKAKLELGKALEKKITQRASTHILNRKERSKKGMVFKVFSKPGHSTIL